MPKVAKNLSFRCLHLIGYISRTNRRNWVQYFPCKNDLCRAIYAARLFGNTFLNFVSNFSLEGSNWLVCLWQHHISKMGYFKCTILFNIKLIVPFHFYLIMTLVVPCLHNMFMVLLFFALGNFKIGATKPIFLDYGSLRGERGGCACVGMVCYHCIVHILNSSKKPYFLCRLL